MKSSQTLVILPYLNAYRVRLFELVQQSSLLKGSLFRVAYGSPSGHDKSRKDAVQFDGGIVIAQSALNLGARRLLLRVPPFAALTSDLVILEHAVKNLDSYLILAIRTLLRKRTALWTHGVTITEPTRRSALVLQRWMLRRASWVFAYTEGSAQRALSNGLRPNRATVLYNTVDTSHLRVDPTQFSQRRYDTALYVGGIDASKRIDRLVHAVSRVREAIPTFKLIVGGAGNQVDLLKPGIAAGWIDYRGPMSPTDKRKAAAEASFMVVSGRVGLVAVDSFALALPIATTLWDYHAPEFEYLNSGNAVVEVDSLDGLVAAMLKLATDDRLRAALQVRCAMDAERYTIENMANNFVTGIGLCLQEAV